MRDFELTAAWQHRLHPRRGTLGAGPLQPEPGAREAVDAYLEPAREDLSALLRASDAPLRDAARAWLDGAADAPPLGAAVVALALMHRDRDSYRAPFADVWIAERGLEFAAGAAVELLGLRIGENRAGPVAGAGPGDVPGDVPGAVLAAGSGGEPGADEVMAPGELPAPGEVTGPGEAAAAGELAALGELPAPGEVTGPGEAAAAGELAALGELAAPGEVTGPEEAAGGTDEPAPAAHDVRFLEPGEEAGRPWWSTPELNPLWRVRAALAGASEAEYTRVVEVLAPHRSRHVYHRLAVALLVPDQLDWVEADVSAASTTADDYRPNALSTAVTDVEQLERLAAAPTAHGSFRVALTSSSGHVATLLDALGAEALPVFLAWLDEDDHLDVQARRRLLEGIAQIPGPAALRALADRVSRPQGEAALLEAASRFPGAALTVLSATGSDGPLADLLRAHVRGHQGLSAALVTELPHESAARVRALLDQAAARPVAPEQALPPLLVTPPWQDRAPTPRPVVIAGLECTDAPAVEWREGEREAFAELPPTHRSPFSPDDPLDVWQQRAADVSRRHERRAEPFFFLDGPDDLARPALATWKPARDVPTHLLRAVTARFGADSVPALLHRARQTPADASPVLEPCFSPDLATQTAEWLARGKALRVPASAWLLRHAAPAARALVPPALGPAGAARRQAEAALRHLAAHGRTAEVLVAAGSYGGEAPAAVEELLARDPLMQLPTDIPAVPDWAVPVLLPTVRLRDRSGVLPDVAALHLLTLFAVSRTDQPYAGLTLVREKLKSADLSAFVWALFQRWFAAGAAPRENWVLDALALAGDAEVAHRLTPLLLTWPGETTQAVAAVRALAAIGSETGNDEVLQHLNTVAQSGPGKSLRQAAQSALAAVADDRGLNPDQLADRLVPHLGLDADGRMRLDYGPRQFVVGLDEKLLPTVVTASGKQLKTLPKPGAKDDPTRAAAAHQRFTVFRKDARRIAPDVVTRLEQAMLSGRLWSAAEFREQFAGHPVLGHLAHRLVCARYEDGRPAVTFRVTGNGRSADPTGIDLAGAEVTWPRDARLGIVHPDHLGDTAGPWRRHLDEAGLQQPFPQLGLPAGPADPGNAADPADSANQVDPANPADSVDPAEAAIPADSGDPTELGNAADPAEPVNAAVSVELADPVDLSDLSEPAAAANPSRPADQVDPAGPADPAIPVDPADPVSEEEAPPRVPHQFDQRDRADAQT